MQTSNIILLLSTAVLALLIVAAFSFYHAGAISIPLAPAQPSVLLVGPSIAGKTALFRSIVHQKTEGATYVSQRANIGQYTLAGGKKIKVVDVPGHPKLFGGFKSYRPQAIVFMLDSSSLSKSIASVTRCLVEILTFARTQNVQEVVVIGNKSDYFTALSSQKIVDLLEAEVEQIRASKHGLKMDSIEENLEESEEWLQDISGKFTLEAEGVKVLTGSVHKGDIASWTDWLEAAFP